MYNLQKAEISGSDKGGKQHVERCVNAESQAEYREYLNPGQYVTMEATDCISRPRSIKSFIKDAGPKLIFITFDDVVHLIKRFSPHFSFSSFGVVQTPSDWFHCLYELSYSSWSRVQTSIPPKMFLMAALLPKIHPDKFCVFEQCMAAARNTVFRSGLQYNGTAIWNLLNRHVWGTDKKLHRTCRKNWSISFPNIHYYKYDDNVW